MTRAKFQPLWKGPQKDGITFSLLSKFLVCRERFRLQVIEGLQLDEGFRHQLEYGSLWHEAEEAFAGGNDWRKAVRKYRDRLRANYPADITDINKWTSVCLTTFPLYIKHWERHPDVRKRKPLLEEYAFAVPYELPSGRTILLRGKWDCVFSQSRELFLQENKSKGRIDTEGIRGTVDQNLQTMLYQIALRTWKERFQQGYSDAQNDIPAGLYNAFHDGYPIKGVLYNVVRRPLSDFHAIKQRKGRLVNKLYKGKPIKDRSTGKNVKEDRRVGAESDEQFYKRLGESISETPDEYFMRWKVTLTDRDVERFKERVFDPVMEQLVDWYDWVANQSNPFAKVDGIPGGGIHWQSPWGVYNSLGMGFRGDYFDLLTKGSRANLHKVKTLFPELS